MGVVTNPDTPGAQEAAKWEAYPTKNGPGLRPYVKYDYPAMFYRAGRQDGQLAIVESEVIGSDVQAAGALSRGFRETPTSAFAAVEAQELEFAKLAANRAYHERRMSPQAQAEAAAVDANSARHVPNIPELPIKRRGRPKKVAEAS